MRDDSWRAGGGRDAYTKRPRTRLFEGDQDLDHVLEVQIVEHAALDLLLHRFR